MKFESRYIDHFENGYRETAMVEDVIKVSVGARIVRSRFAGPGFLNRGAQVGPDAEVGRYFGTNENSYVARCEIGHYCSFGARSAINPFNHPRDWLSINEFQYHPKSFDWIEEYNDFERVSRDGEVFPRVTIGSDVWIGHNVNVMGGVDIGHGAIVAAGAVVTKDIPPYAIVAGMPGEIIRMRFPAETVERLITSAWWDLELAELSGLPFRDVDRCLDAIADIRGRRESLGAGP